MTNDFTVIGGGSWGCALACLASKNQQMVHLIMRDRKIIEEILSSRTNSKYLYDLKLPENIIPSDDFTLIKNAKVIIIAVPSSSLKEVIKKIASVRLDEETTLLIATKGLSSDPVEFISEMIPRYIKNPVAFLMGPNFASEVASNVASSATIASKDLKTAEKLALLLSSDKFQIFTTDDVITLQVAGAVKNIIAIKSGIYMAAGAGANTIAALLSEGLREIHEIAKLFGGKAESLWQPGAAGDLALTCYSTLSRNTKFGYDFALSTDKKNFIKNYPHLVEGRIAAELVLELVKDKPIEIPVIKSVAELFH